MRIKVIPCGIPGLGGAEVRLYHNFNGDEGLNHVLHSYFMYHQRKLSKRILGFSIVEILTILVVLGVLASLAVPVISNSLTKKARQSEAETFLGTIRRSQIRYLSRNNSYAANISSLDFKAEPEGGQIAIFNYKIDGASGASFIAEANGPLFPGDADSCISINQAGTIASCDPIDLGAINLLDGPLRLSAGKYRASNVGLGLLGEIIFEGPGPITLSVTGSFIDNASRFVKFVNIDPQDVTLNVGGNISLGIASFPDLPIVLPKIGSSRCVRIDNRSAGRTQPLISNGITSDFGLILLGSFDHTINGPIIDGPPLDPLRCR
jgi:type II secretory pathway pseudopilin PulG